MEETGESFHVVSILIFYPFFSRHHLRVSWFNAGLLTACGLPFDAGRFSWLNGRFDAK